MSADYVGSTYEVLRQKTCVLTTIISKDIYAQSYVATVTALRERFTIWRTEVSEEELQQCILPVYWHTGKGMDYQSILFFIQILKLSMRNAFLKIKELV